MRGYRLTTLGKVVVFSFFFLIILSTAYTVKAIKYRQGNTNQNITSDKAVPAAGNINIINREIFNTPVVSKLGEAPETDVSKLKNTKLTIYFDPDDNQIKVQYYEALNMLSNVADILKDFIIVVEGNCATANADTNDNRNNIISYNLSVARANAVLTYLQDKGIDASRIVIIGNGSSKPVKPNTTEEGRQYNRRVEISFKLKEN